MIQIELTQGQVALVDDIDADLAEFNWHSFYNYKVDGYYAIRNVTNSSGRRTTELMHRVILSRMLGRPLSKLELVDHIKHITLDNRRSEIRIATPSQNSQNRRKQSNNTSGYTGVWLNKNTGRWAAEIWVGRVKKFIGYFDTLELAKEARNTKALELFGEYKYKE